MKIDKLSIENLKRISKVEITPGADCMVLITGANGAGKSSVLDAIWWALAGERGIQSAPIRNGEKTARVSLDLGDVVVTREWARRDDDSTTTRIRVENAEGARFPSPQKMLDSLLGSLTFDPLKFARGRRERAGRDAVRAVRSRHGRDRGGAPGGLRGAGRPQPDGEAAPSGGRRDHRAARHA